MFYVANMSDRFFLPEFASVSTETDIPSGAVVCQEENTRKRYLYLLNMK